jgi:hypothetical protein
MKRRFFKYSPVAILRTSNPKLVVNSDDRYFYLWRPKLNSLDEEKVRLIVKP